MEYGKKWLKSLFIMRTNTTKNLFDITSRPKEVISVLNFEFGQFCEARKTILHMEDLKKNF